MCSAEIGEIPFVKSNKNQKFGGIPLLNSIESLQSSHMPSGFVVSFIPQILQMTFALCEFNWKDVKRF